MSTAILPPLLAAEVSQARVTTICGDQPDFVCKQALQVTDNELLARAAEFIVGKPLTILLILALAFVANRLVRRALKHALRGLSSGAVKERLGNVRRRTPNALIETEEISLRANQRIEALASVLRSVSSFVIFGIAALMILSEVGVDLGPLLAGAGILGVALGFGSQSLVKDFLAGMFILIEDQYGVGDIIEVETTVAGIVESVSLRTTRIRSVDGTVWHVPNGTIARVGNKSQLWSRVLLDVQVAYATDIEHARTVIKRVADAIWKDDDHVLDEPEVWGVENLGPNGVDVRLVVKTTPTEQYRIARRVREALKSAFDQEGIEIPFPQQASWIRGDLSDQDASGNGGGRSRAAAAAD